jgi:pyrroline-5-carboxylate reductase
LQVRQISTGILVVDVRSSQGLAADSLQDDGHGSTSLSGSQQVQQTQILTLALPPDQVQDVLHAVATAKKQGGLLWTTLAKP